MIVKPELVNKIKDYFDLNIYETKVWLALLSKGVASAGEIARISRVPRSRTYDVLESLEKRGFAIEKLGKPVMYMGVKPKGILERLKTNVRKDADEKISYLANIKDTDEFRALEEMYQNSTEPMKKEELPLSLKGKAVISGYVKEILAKAKNEVIICNDAEDIKSKLSLFRKTVELLRKSGIIVRMALSGEKEAIDGLSQALGIKIKQVEIHAKFFIIDRKEILFYLSKSDESGEESAIWINSEFFSRAFSDLFSLGIGF